VVERVTKNLVKVLSTFLSVLFKLYYKEWHYSRCITIVNRANKWGRKSKKK